MPIDNNQEEFDKKEGRHKAKWRVLGQAAFGAKGGCQAAISERLQNCDFYHIDRHYETKSASLITIVKSAALGGVELHAKHLNLNRSQSGTDIP